MNKRNNFNNINASIKLFFPKILINKLLKVIEMFENLHKKQCIFFMLEGDLEKKKEKKIAPKLNYFKNIFMCIKVSFFLFSF